MDLSRQTTSQHSTKNNFTGKLEENDGATMLFVAEKQEETI